MAQVTTGRIYECAGHSQEGHELAANHPVVVVGRQSLIDNQKIAIVVPMTSTRPHHPVHWAVEIEDTNSHAYIRHVKSVHITKIGDSLGIATPEEMDDIKDGLARELQYDNHDCAKALGREVRPGRLWSASIPNARGLSYERRTADPHVQPRHGNSNRPGGRSTCHAAMHGYPCLCRLMTLDSRRWPSLTKYDRFPPRNVLPDT